MAKCFECGAKTGKWGGSDALYFPEDKLKEGLLDMGISDSKVNQMQEKDVLCEKCGKKVYCRHAVEVYRHFESTYMPDEFQEVLNSGEDWVAIAKAELSNNSTLPKEKTATASKDSPIGNIGTSTPSKSSSRITTAADLTRLLQTRHDKTKSQWNKNGVVQYKDENIAILQRMWGQQVQFIIACSQVTNEGYRLMAIDEGKEGGQSSGGFVGGLNAYFYFQKMDYVR